MNLPTLFVNSNCHVLLRVLPILLGLLLTGCGAPKRSQPVIGLMTDYGTHDAYVGQLKGSIFSVNPEARVLDISHEIEPYNLVEGAFLISEASRDFPKGTIFVAIAGTGSGPSHADILVKTREEKFYLAPDNGLLTFVIQREGFDQAWELRETSSPDHLTSATFPRRNALGPVAAGLANGVPPETYGEALKTWQRLKLPQAKFSGHVITGDIIHIDHEGNLITNIPADFSDQLASGKAYRVTLGKQTVVAPMVRTAGEFPAVGRVLLLYNSADLLEISVNQGSASRILKVEGPESVVIQP